MHAQLIVIVALTLNTANVMGYTKCDKDARKRQAAAASPGTSAGQEGGIFGQAAGALGSFMAASIVNAAAAAVTKSAQTE